jgi:hypothetical protein
MRYTDPKQLFLDNADPSTPLGLASLILKDCMRDDWSHIDVERRLESVYHEQSPDTAAQVLVLLKTIVKTFQAEA